MPCGCTCELLVEVRNELAPLRTRIRSSFIDLQIGVLASALIGPIPGVVPAVLASTGEPGRLAWLTAIEFSLFGRQRVVVFQHIFQATSLALSAALVYDAVPRVAVFAMDIAVAIGTAALRGF